MFSKLPIEIINQIFLFDNTYRIIYNKSILLISGFPTFLYSDKNIHYYNIFIMFGSYKYVAKVEFIEKPSNLYLGRISRKTHI